MPDLPTGTVTFLFTDIEGSTRLWEQHPDAMRIAVARHDALLCDALETNGGHIFGTAGDSFCAAFGQAPEALLAALDAQRALGAEAWEEIGALRVRMALHTGAAEVRDGDYFGPALNRAARLLAAGHGGQILLSDAAHGLVQDALSPGAALRDLGEHRLRDLARPDRIYQLVHPDLPADFPPLLSLAERPTNLPQQVTRFVGREKEMAELKRLLGTTRLVTLTGTGGTGKTRLALEAAGDLLPEYPDGAWLVELAPLTDPLLVPQTVASILGVQEAGAREPPFDLEADSGPEVRSVGPDPAGRPILQTLVDALKSKRLLLVLDNCEHLLAGCAQLAEVLLRGCPGLRVLATSREGLNIPGETTYRLPSLSLPDPRHLPPTLERFTEYEAIRLFLDRAAAAVPSFSITMEHAPAVAQVCYRLDGIPLAIELAASRVKVLSVAEIAARLDDRFRLLTGGSRTALPRQQTLRALIDWSYDLLSEPERVLLRRLSVFAGGWTLEAAEAICSGIQVFRSSGPQDDSPSPSPEHPAVEEWEVLDLLTALVEKSLVAVEEGTEEGSRYRLLETVRQYCRDRLLESGEGAAVRGRHRDFFLAIAEEAEPKLDSAEQAFWLRRLEREHDNLRAALTWSLGEAEKNETAIRLAGVLSPFWGLRAHYVEGRQWLEDALAQTRSPARTPARAKALLGAGPFAFRLGDLAASHAYAEESMQIGRELGDKRIIARSLIGLASTGSDYQRAYNPMFDEALTIARELGDPWFIAECLLNLGQSLAVHARYDAARAHLEEGLAIARAVGDNFFIANALSIQGRMVRDQGDAGTARTLVEQCLVIARASGFRRMVAAALVCLGVAARDEGDYETARALTAEGLAEARDVGVKGLPVLALLILGQVARDQGDYPAARALLAESLAASRETPNRWHLANCLKAIAELAAVEGRAERAARLFGAAEAYREAAGPPLPPADRAEYERHVTAARVALGKDRFAVVWKEGRWMPLDEAIDEALQERGHA